MKGGFTGIGPLSTQLKIVTAFDIARGILIPRRNRVLSDTQAIALAFFKHCCKMIRLKIAFGNPKFDGMSYG